MCCLRCFTLDLQVTPVQCARRTDHGGTGDHAIGTAAFPPSTTWTSLTAATTPQAPHAPRSAGPERDSCRTSLVWERTVTATGGGATPALVWLARPKASRMMPQQM